MKPADLQIGSLYRLTQDVENPVTDRRSANKMLKLETFKKGTTFVCMCGDDSADLRMLRLTNHSLTGHLMSDGFTAAIIQDGEVRSSKREESQQWAAALVPHLEELPIDSWKRLRAAYGWHATARVLQNLVEDGTVPLQRVVDLMRNHTIGMTGD